MNYTTKFSTVFSAIALALLLTVSFSGNAAATSIFSDNFNTDNGSTGVLNYGSTTNVIPNWTITHGTIDLIGQGTQWDFFPNNGLYLDMDGSTNAAGTIKSSLINFTPGNYTLTFDLAGSARDGYPQETLNLLVGNSTGNLVDNFYTLTSTAPYGLFTATFTVAQEQQGNIIFSESGGSNVGMILDNVNLERQSAPVPEPGTMMLLGAGLLGLVIYGKRRKNA